MTLAIAILQGVPHENSRPWASQWRTGSLTKLKKYCEQLSTNTFHQNKTYFQLQKHVYRAWICCLHCFEMLKVSQPSASPFTSTFKPLLPTPLNRTLLSMNGSLANASKLLLKALRQFDDEPTVLAFLSRHRDILVSIYGVDAIEQLIIKMPPIRHESEFFAYSPL